ncbi:unnamed protein product [Euphydryas editha]|uniref:Uncharacterized protein n=1 Tax=Euphydryas editha TaxID=104508 RepID=A0AAU9TN13_EUPED|nr:unnamed protein product [Euphydryas editha]
MVNPLVRKFYLIITALITKCGDFHQLTNIFKGTLIISSSPIFGMDENDRLSLAGEEFNRLHGLVRGDTFVNKVTELVEQSDEKGPAVNEADEESGINIFEWGTYHFTTIHSKRFQAVQLELAKT